MHLAPLSRRVLVGLPVVVLCFAVLPVAFAWELFGSSSSKSRPAANSPTAGVQGSNAAQAGRGGPLFHGQELRWPTMPFTRNKPEPKMPVHRAYAGANRTAPYAANQTASRFSGTTSGQVARSPQQMSYNPSAAPVRPQPTAAPVARDGGGYEFVQGSNQTLAQNRQPQPAIRSASRVYARPLAATVNATPREPISAPAESNPTPAAAMADAPASLADRLVTQAHEWSGSARTEADYTRMIDACRRARASQPSPDTARYAGQLASWAFNRRGQLRAEAGRHQDALADFDDAIRADPERWLAIHNRGMLLAQSGEFERAFDDFTRTIQLNPKFAKAYSNRAALLMVAGDVQTALADYRRAIELEPALAVAHRGCGRAYHWMRQLDESLEHYDEAVRLAPEDAYAVACRADLLTDMGRYAEAVAEYGRTIQLDPKSAHAYSSSAWLLATCPDASVRNSELAIEHAKMAIELSGQRNAVSYDTLAAAQANAGDFSAAIQSVRQAVQLAPPEERELYEARLVMYQHAKPYRIAPVGEVMQASYESY